MHSSLKKKNLLFVGLFAAVLFVFVVKGDFTTMATILLKVNLLWLSFGFGCILLYWGLEALTFHLMLSHNGLHISYAETLKLVVSTQFFNGVTPFSSGGQPFQIYILTQKNKLSLSGVTSASLHNFIVYQFILVILGILAFCFNLYSKDYVVSNSQPFLSIALLGFVLNLFVIVGLLLLAVTPKITYRLVFFFLKLLEFTPFKKKVNHSLVFVEHFLKDFHTNCRELMNNRPLLLKASIINCIKLTVFYLIAYFSCRSIGFNQVHMLDAIIASAYIMLITSFIPMPGASGGSELSFLFLFGTLLTLPQVTVVMLLWRFITYYFGLCIGFLTLSFGYPQLDSFN
jgi:glycosyltransferase 2 family protein